MVTSAREPEFKHTEEFVAAKSKLANDFIERRKAGNTAVNNADNNLVKRFYNIDHNTYLNGALGASVKELIGLAASAVLRCDDCIYYHIIQAYRIGCTRAEIEETLNISLVVGGSIFIPHMRRAYMLLDEVYAD